MSIRSGAVTTRELHADCSRCFALCCVALAFRASSDFAVDKEIGDPCRNLKDDYRCGIHARLRTSGFTGCTVYDCFGAGQRVSQETFGGTSWRDDSRAMFDVFPVMRQLHELLWYLTSALDITAARPAHQDVRFQYRDRTGATSSRRVEPYRQVLLDGRWYLLAWDRDREDWRTFRLDRVGDLEVPGSTFIPRLVPPAVSFVQDIPDRPVDSAQGVVRFHAPVSLVAERLVPQGGSLEAIDAETCRYVTVDESWEWLAMMVAMVGVRYTIEAPEELIESTRLLSARLRDAILDA
ncbi:helix-turn-helix transcriptional regulator [Kibdelosporangium lantanae]|uniref:Helix-turn-helix transcriptional regulator n=1 Tax=Kibdelosporangium lantanae TaxID=1497396 RepID=A0ABW3M793_9PSEU